VEAAIAISIKIAKWLTNGSFEPLYVSFAHSPPKDLYVQETQKLFGCQVRYNQNSDAIYFDQRLLSLPINQNNEQVHSLMLTLANNAMSRLPSNGFSSLVGELIRQHPALDKNEISKMLSISSRHLCRKLTREGTSFRVIQSDVRYQLAKEWLIDNVHIQDIVDRFSFFDERSFSKAFKRWSGVTPNQFRTQLHQKHE
jgi:AraC-like DNA-binding protein